MKIQVESAVVYYRDQDTSEIDHSLLSGSRYKWHWPAENKAEIELTNITSESIETKKIYLTESSKLVLVIYILTLFFFLFLFLFFSFFFFFLGGGGGTDC